VTDFGGSTAQDWPLTETDQWNAVEGSLRIGSVFAEQIQQELNGAAPPGQTAHAAQPPTGAGAAPGRSRFVICRIAELSSATASSHSQRSHDRGQPD